MTTQNPFPNKISEEIWNMKYRLKNFDGTIVDQKVEDTWLRIAKSLSEKEKDYHTVDKDGLIDYDNRAYWQEKFYEALKDFKFCPAGRIIAGAGTGRDVTLFNCYVMGTVHDSMGGIFTALKEAALTMQQGGGIGYDFSTIRPKGAEVKGVNADASGPLSFMHVWDAMCQTVISAGSRRGAMMATMRCDHPDILDFIKAKQNSTHLRMFNMSVLVTDKFMDAVKNKLEWHLIFGGKVYTTISACDLWDQIMQSTYDYAEPGVIFIDRINKINNLWYIESIASTNPCVTGDTPILTDKGYVPIESVCDQPISIWNGFEWSDVTPRMTSRDEKVLRIEFSDGAELQCTPYHKFILENGKRVEARGLVEGDKLIKHGWPSFEAEHKTDDPHAYRKGSFCGNDSEQGHKPPVPDINATVKSRKDWLTGLIDSVGYMTKDGCIQITSKDKGFLIDIKHMINTLGVSGSVAPQKECFELNLSLSDVVGLDLQHHLKRGRKPQGNVSRSIKVLSIKEVLGTQPVYCFNEPKNNSGIFGGVITSNCGEQPLPPYGACLLGSINLTRLVKNPFREDADINLPEMEDLVATAVRMMDNVIDVSKFPLEVQEEEAYRKRRIGLGITGLADALLMCGIKYGSDEAVEKTEYWMKYITHSAYKASINLAKEKGSFPLFNEEYLKSEFIQNLDDSFFDIQNEIKKHGIRNSHLTSIAPTGTISLYMGNVSSGIEPIFAKEYTRKVLQPDGSKIEEKVMDYAVQLWQEGENGGTVPNWYVDTQSLSPLDHVRMQAAAQKWVDSSISKTINCPEDISFDDFKGVYMAAWDQNCKGCTTYRPNDITGSILSTDSLKGESKTGVKEQVLLDRPENLKGSTYKLKFGGEKHAMYITINDIELDGKQTPFEVFINSKNTEHYAWTVALTRMISAIFRRGGDISFVSEELKAVFDPQGGGFHKGKYVPSVLAAIGGVIETHLKEIGYAVAGINDKILMKDLKGPMVKKVFCPKCSSTNFIRQSGCTSCMDCGYSKCG